MRHSLDCSNYSGFISADQFGLVRDDHDVAAIFVQSLAPPPGYPPGMTAQQINQALQAGGIAVHAYVFWWYGVGTDYLKRQLDLLDSFVGSIQRVWIDVEDTTGGAATSLRRALPVGVPHRPQPAQLRARRQPPVLAKHAPKMLIAADSRVQDVAAWLSVADQYPTLLGPAGIYGSSWHWIPYMGNSWSFSQAGRTLWAATYNDLETLTDWDWFGGWSGEAAVHQYAGTSEVGGIRNVDLNVVADQELGSEPAESEIDQAWLDKKSFVVSKAGEMLALCDQLNAEANRRMGPRRAPVLELTSGLRDRATFILA